MALTQLTKIDGGGISTTSDYRVGVITASKFVGPFDGTAGNFSGIITASGANFTGNVTIGGTLTYEDVTNIDSVGIITAQKDIHVGAGVSAIGVGTFSGLDINGDIDVDGHTNLDNVSVAGVTTITSSTYPLNVHADTAYQGILVNGNNAPTIGFNIADNATPSWKLGLSGASHTNFALSQGAGNSDVLRIDTSGEARLFGDLITGTVTIDSNLIHDADTDTMLSFVPSGDIIDLKTGGSTRLRVENSGVVITGVTTFSASAHVSNASGSVFFGAGSDTAYGSQGGIGRAGGANYHIGSSAIGDLCIAAEGSKRILFGTKTGTGIGGITKRMSIASSGQVTIDGNLDAVGGIDATANSTFAGDIDVDGHTNLDNVSIAGVTTFSTSPVVPNGTYYKGVINSGSQEKIVGGYISGSNTLRLGESMYLTMNPERLGLGINDPQRTLHLSSNNTVIALTDTAAGTNQKTKYILSDAGVFAVGKLSDDYNTATEHLYIDNNGLVIINRGGNGGTADVNADNFVVKNYDSSSSCGISILNADNQNSTLYFGNASDTKHAEVVWSDAANLFLIGTSNAGASIKFRVASQSDALTIDSNGHLLPGSVGSQNLGSASAEWGDIYIADDKKITLGSGDDFEIFHSGGVNFLFSPNNRQLQLKGDGGLLIRAGGNQLIANFLQSAVTLYHNVGNLATARLTTTSTGITVTGEVAASQEYPDIQPTFDANFAASRTLDPRFTFQRVGPASFVNEFGKVVLVGENVPRFDHDLTTRESLGILIEEARTNLALYSDMDMDSIGSGYYGNVNLARAEGPDGVADSALQVTFTASGSSFVRSGLIPCSAGVEYTFSVWIKKVSGSFNNSFFSYPQNAAAGLFNNSGFVNTEGQSLSAMPTGVWKRFTQTRTTASGTTAMDFVMPGYDSNGAVIQYYGLQMEAGAYATSYIPSTNGSATSRGADLLRIMDDEFKDIFGDEFKEFTIVADYDNSDTVDGTVQSLIDFWGESTGYTDRIEIFKDGDSPYNIEVRGIANNAGLFANGVANASSKAATQRFATSWSVDYTTNNAANRKWAFSFSGEAVDVIGDLTGTDVPAITRLGLGNTPTRLDMSPGKLHFKRFTFYPKAVSDQQLINLSTP